MPYFKGSTANPTGIRPWNFAMQGTGSGSNGLGGLGRGGRMGRLRFYVNSAYPLPQASNGPLMLTAGVPGGQRGSLGDFLPRIPLLATSPYSGKADYGDPPPAYGPLNPTYYKMGLGINAILDSGVRPIGAPIRPFNPVGPVIAGTYSTAPPVVTGAGTPVPVTSPVSPISTLMPVNQQNSWWQQMQANLAAQQAAAQQATASAAAAAPASQAAVATNPAMFTTDSAGDIINATGGAIFLTAAQASALGVTAASLNAGGPSAAAAALTAANNMAATGTAATAPSWFTDPTQELITGLPNWGLLAIAGGVFYLFKKK